MVLKTHSPFESAATCYERALLHTAQLRYRYKAIAIHIKKHGPCLHRTQVSSAQLSSTRLLGIIRASIYIMGSAVIFEVR